MPSFALVWEQHFHEDFGADRTITTGSGILVVKANSLIEVEAEVRKYEGAATNYREGISVNRIESRESGEMDKDISAIRNLLDPWHSR